MTTRNFGDDYSFTQGSKDMVITVAFEGFFLDESLAPSYLEGAPRTPCRAGRSRAFVGFRKPG